MRNRLALVAGLAAASLLVTFLGAIFVPPGDPVSHGPTGNSLSAVGHKAFLALLDRDGVPVERRRARPERGADTDRLLLVVEPQLERVRDGERRFRELVEGGGAVLVVLPKWSSPPHESDPRWVSTPSLLGDDTTRVLLAALGTSATPFSCGDPEEASDRLGPGNVPRVEQLRLLRDTDLLPLIGKEDGLLLGQVPGTGDARRVYVLSDPDLLDNAHLAAGDNASLALRIVERVRPADAPVVYDETLHGQLADESLWRALGRFPLVLFLAQLGIVAAVMLSSGMQRFGAPLPARPALAPGKRVLIERTAELLATAGHGPSSLRRFLADAFEAASDAWRLPRARGGGVNLDALEGLCRRREVRPGPSELSADVAAAVAARGDGREHRLKAARRIHDWREEVTGAHR